MKKLGPILTSLYFIYLMPRLLFMEPNGNMWAGYINIWGDWATHLTYANHFASKPLSMWFSDNPLFTGTSFHYPPGVNLFSSILIRLGFTPLFSLWSVSLVCLLLVVGISYALFLKKLKSERLASLTVLIIFFGGGLSFLLYFKDQFLDPNRLSTLFFPIREYSHWDEMGLSYGGHLLCLWLPQRAISLGFALGALFLFALETPLRKPLAITTGIVTGLLPACHVHTCVAVGVALLSFAAFRPRELKAKLYFLLPFLVTAGALWLLLHRHSPTGSFLGWLPGWIATSSRSHLSWPVYWLWNWGIFLPLVFLSHFVEKKRFDWLTTSGIFLFLVANLIRFQPWDWDNTKIFVWSYFMMAPRAALGIRHIYHHSRLGPYLAMGLTFLLLGGGMIDAFRLLHLEKLKILMFDREEVIQGVEIQKIIPPEGRVLSSTDAHDWVSALGGRSVVMGFNGWLWSYGVNYWERESDIRTIYESTADITPLLNKYQVDYVVIDKQVRGKFKLNEKNFERFPVVYERGGTRVHLRR